MATCGTDFCKLSSPGENGMRSCNWKGKFGQGIRGNTLTEKKIHIEIGYEKIGRGHAVLWLSVHGHPNHHYSLLMLYFGQPRHFNSLDKKLLLLLIHRLEAGWFFFVCFSCKARFEHWNTGCIFPFLVLIYLGEVVIVPVNPESQRARCWTKRTLSTSKADSCNASLCF